MRRLLLQKITNPNLTFDTYGVCNDLGDADVVNTIWYYNYKFLNNVNNALSALGKQMMHLKTSIIKVYAYLIEP